MKKYKVNEIFYSIQGEGRFAGEASVFVRFAGCNKSCKFCDTNHQSFVSLTASKIVQRIFTEAHGGPRRFSFIRIILTGGEPFLQVDLPLIKELRRHFDHICVETNGSVPLPAGLERCNLWITMSPKQGVRATKLRSRSIAEIKLLHSVQKPAMVHVWQRWFGVIGRRISIQPVAVCQDPVTNSKNMQSAIALVLAEPQARLSVQLHKMIEVR